MTKVYSPKTIDLSQLEHHVLCTIKVWGRKPEAVTTTFDTMEEAEEFRMIVFSNECVVLPKGIEHD